jgi:hypothetical protein
VVATEAVTAVAAEVVVAGRNKAAVIR